MFVGVVEVLSAMFSGTPYTSEEFSHRRGKRSSWSGPALSAYRPYIFEKSARASIVDRMLLIPSAQQKH